MKFETSYTVIEGEKARKMYEIAQIVEDAGKEGWRVAFVERQMDGSLWILYEREVKGIKAI